MDFATGNAHTGTGSNRTKEDGKNITTNVSRVRSKEKVLESAREEMKVEGK